MRIVKWKMPDLSRCYLVSADRNGRTRPRPARARHAALSIAAALVLGACAAPRPAPVSDRVPSAKVAPKAEPSPATKAPGSVRPESYTVKPSDTLYSIALEFGVDYRDLATWNGIDPTRIKAGQQLRLSPPQGVIATPLQTLPGGVEVRPLGSMVAPGVPAAAGGGGAEPRGVRVPYSDQAFAQMAGLAPEAVISVPRPAPFPPPKPPAPRGPDEVDWIWPTSGKIVSEFNAGSGKGIGIGGKAGQAVVAAAPGRVIFSGTGIRGLGKLIVIKHNDKYLSVYGHNRALLVKEGQTVSRGQRIAEMGDTDADQVKLHFEIRQQGKPIDPAPLLPPS